MGILEPSWIFPSWIFEIISPIQFSISVVSSLSYLLIVSVFIDNCYWGAKKEEHKAKSKHKSRLTGCIAYLAIIFTVDVIFTVQGWEVYANYIFLVITAVVISRSPLIRAAKGKYGNCIAGLSFALTILVAFQWIVAFVGSLAFLLLPHDGLVDNPLFVSALLCAHIGVAALLRKYRSLVFRVDTSNKLLIIDIGAKAFFIVFFNLIFPNYFVLLGMFHYSVLTLVLLTTALIFALYREYSISLEKQIAVYNNNQAAIMKQAIQAIAKYEDMAKAELVQKIGNPIVQALLYEVVHAGERHGIDVEISVDSPRSSSEVKSLNATGSRSSSMTTEDAPPFDKIGYINLNNYDLHGIINSFIESAVIVAKSQNTKTIFVDIEDDNNEFVFKVMVEAQPSTSRKSNFMADCRAEKDYVMSLMREKSNVSINISRKNGFTQVLRIT